MASTSRVEIEKFDGTNDFGLWKMKMLAHLGNMGLVKALEGEAKLPASMDAEKKEEVLSRAYNTLILSVGDKVLRELVKLKSAAEIWLKLESLYMTKNLSNRLYLKGKFFTFKMADGKNLREHIDDYVKLLVDLDNIEVKYEDEDKALVLLHSLPKSYEHFVDILKHGRETITLEDAIGALKSKEQEWKKEVDSNGDSLMVRGRTNKKDMGYKNKGRSKSRNGKRTIKCYKCHGEGHMKRDCPKWKAEDKEKTKDDGKAAIVQEVEEGYESADVLVVSRTHSDKQWILDSGCSFHMTPNRSWFETYDTGVGGEVLLGDNKACKVVGIGSVRIKMHDGTVRSMSDVRHVPDLRRNLISLGMLDNNGFEYKGSKSTVKVTKGSLVVMKGVWDRGLYVLQGTTVVGDAAAVTEARDSLENLWHKRLGHVSERGLKELERQGLFGKEKLDDMEFCENCIYGKSTRVKFNRSTMKTRDTVSYIHSDLWGPSRTETLGGGRYFITFIDDCSRKIWVYILKRKDEAFAKFKEWKKMIEVQTGKKVKKLRTDNGLEFLGDEFNQFIKEEGMVRHKTVRKTPQQNGLAERMNRTLLERVRCMLFEAGLPKRFWGEAVNTAAKLINRCPSAALDFKTPEEVWNGTPPNLGNLKVFGCVAYVHQKEGKLDPRAKKCMFVGYPEGVKGYKLMYKEEGGAFKSIISRDVVFRETEYYMSSQGADGANAEKAIARERAEIEVELLGVSTEKEPEDEGETSGVGGNLEEEEQEEASEEDLSSYQLARDRSRRTGVQAPLRYGYSDLVSFAMIVADEFDDLEPRSYREVATRKDKELWMEAMREEMVSLDKNATWELVERPKNQKIVGCKWVYKLKEGFEGIEPKHKARLVAKGFSQREGVDFNEIYSPVVKHTSIRVMLALVNQFDLELEQMDVKTKFLHGNLE